MQRSLSLMLAMLGLALLAQCMSTAPESITEMTKAQMPLEPASGTATQATEDIGPSLNALRRSNGVAPITADAALTRAASAHVQDMGRNGFIGHTGSDGSGVRDRIGAQGFSACYIAENVARGQKSTQEVMTTWQNSPGHRTNMLNPKARSYGFARGPGNTWSLVLAEPGC